MRKPAAVVGIGLATIIIVGVAAIEIRHRATFGHFVGYGVHADIRERSGDIGIPGIRTLYAARVSNYTLFPLRLAGWNCVSDIPGPPGFCCRYQIQKFSRLDGHWIAVVEVKPLEGFRGPLKHKTVYPFGSLLPMDWGAYGALNTLQKGDMVRFAIFTNLNAPAADVYTQPFWINELRTTESSSARSTR